MMGPLAAIAIGAAVLGTSLATPPEPTPLPPHPLTDVQREMLESGMFESDSFREPAFEALIENVRNWHPDTVMMDATDLNEIDLDQFGSIFANQPGAGVFANGEIMMIDRVGDAFPGVERLSLRVVDRHSARPLLVFTADQQGAASVGDWVRVNGLAYKVMLLQRQRDDQAVEFPAIVGQIKPIGSQVAPSMTGVAIITALTGALAVVLFIVVMGRHMLGRPAPRRSPLASAADRPDDPSDA